MLYSILKATLQPYFLLLFFQGLVLLWLRRRRVAARGAVGWLVAAWAMLVLLSVPLAGRLLLGTLEYPYPLQQETQAEVDAIVVLGGGLVPPDGLVRRARPSDSSYARCVHAATLHEIHGCPLILCGGVTQPDETPESEAQVMADALAFLGVADEAIVLESSSRSTRENARQAAAILRERGFGHVLLVTHARHMRRADGCFRKLGIRATPSPCSAVSARLWQDFHDTWIPSPQGLDASNWALQEWLGLLYYRLRGWI